MSMVNFLTDLHPAINGIVAASLALFVAPRFLRAKGTGEYIGFKEIALLYIFLGWAIFKALTIIPEFGMTWEAATRILVSAAVPFVGAYVWVKLTDRYGWEKSHQIRQ